MPLFDTQAPTETKWQPPSYLNNLNGLQKFGLGLGGFNDNGTRNTWGHIASWIPGLNIESDLIAKGIAKNDNAPDALANINDAEQHDIGKLEAVGGAGLGVAGAITANPELIKAGIGLGEQGIGQTTATPQPNIGEQTTRTMNVPAYARGGVNFKTYLPKDNLGNAVTEDMAMVDKHTGKVAGQISYNERIFSQGDNKNMEALAKAKKYLSLGKFVSSAMDKQSANKNKATAGSSLKLEKGGKLTADKAKQILTDGTVYGKPITEKQKKLFGYVAGGGDIAKYEDGGEVMKYDGGGDVIDPGGSSDGGTAFDLGKGYGLTDSLNTTSLPAGTSGATVPTPDHSGLDNILGQVGGAENIFNIAKFLTGIHGATQPLPTFQKPAAWQNYVNTRAQMANEGYTPTELAGQNRSIQEGLAEDQGQIRDISGGNSAYALGAGGGAVNRYVGNKLALGVSGADLHRNNIDAYGNVLGADLGIDAANFGRKYDAAVATKNAASGLAQEGLQSSIDKINYDKTYGKGSMYQKYLQSQIDATDRLKKIDYSKAEGNMSSGNNAKGEGNASYTPNITDGAFWKKYYLAHPELLTQ